MVTAVFKLANVLVTMGISQRTLTVTLTVLKLTHVLITICKAIRTPAIMDTGRLILRTRFQLIQIIELQSPRTRTKEEQKSSKKAHSDH
jgi:hypothetical protein